MLSIYGNEIPQHALLLEFAFNIRNKGMHGNLTCIGSVMTMYMISMGSANTAEEKNCEIQREILLGVRIRT